MTRVLAIDAGTSSVRALSYLADGTAETGAEAHVAYEPVGGEVDPERLVAAARSVVEEVTREAGGSFDAVACSCFWHSLLPLDRDGRPLGPLVTWQDLDASPHAALIARDLGRDALHERTGCYPHPSYWPAQILRLREERPDDFRRTARFATFAEYLYLQLAGAAACSVCLASGTGLLDVRTLDWDAELLDYLQISTEQLPVVGDEPVGDWLPPLGDGACSNVGAGALGPGAAALMIGTSGAFRTVHEDGAPPRDGLFLYRLDGERVVEGGAVSAGGNLHAWLEQTLRFEELPPLDELQPDGHGLTFLPLLGGERAPNWNPLARGAIVGLTFATTPEQIVQAGLEGVAYHLAEVADRMPEVTEVVATGGALIRNQSWVQVLADVLERPLTLSGVTEASTRGAAVLALERLGETPEPAPRGRTFQPQEQRVAAYRSARERQRALYETLT